MKSLFTKILGGTVVLIMLGVYVYLDYSWAHRIKAEVPSSWILVYEARTRWLIRPWTFLYPSADVLWYFKRPPKKFDLKITGGQSIAVFEIAFFTRSEEGGYRSTNWAVVSLDKRAWSTLTREQLDQLWFGDFNTINFDWQTVDGDAVTAIISYCVDHASQMEIIREGSP